MQEFCATALIVTCEEGHVEVARILIQNGAAVNYQEKVNCDMSMHCFRRLDTITCHLYKLSLQDGSAPLHYASAYGHPSLVELLIECGAHLDIRNKVQ